jgi:DNA-binding NtrC family response regulator
MPSKKILVIDDDRSILEVVAMRLEASGFKVTAHTSARDALYDFKRTIYQAALVDLKLDRENGIEVMEQLHEHDPMLPVIIMTAYGTIESTVEAMRRGATGYVTKPFEMDAVLEEVDRAVKTRRQKQPVTSYLDEIIGVSQVLERVKQQILQVASSDATVLILGESGTGKELAARAIHSCGRRANGPFIAVNCGAIPEPLQESELFGHVKGAFTGAIRDKQGLFRRAEGGTLLLDEIAETSPALQVGLLRVLQEKEVRAVGGNQSTRVNVRVLAATNRKLDEEVTKGKFRKDLFYRLHVIPLTIPPLRERKEDIPLLAAHFIKRLARTAPAGVKRLGPATIEALRHYSWPGNVRELQNVLERAVITSAAEEIGAADLVLSRMDFEQETGGERLLNLPPGGATLEAIEKEAILQALRSQDWVQKKAGVLLGISPRVMTYKVKKYGITKEN